MEGPKLFRFIEMKIRFKIRSISELANCAKLATVVDRLYVYDNSENFAEPKLLFRVADSKVEKIYKNINAWSLNIYQNV